MKQKSRKYLGFTLIELMTVTVIIGLILPCIVTIYTFMIKSNREFILRQSAIQQGYEFFERLNILMQDYTIDYEEYYNRQMVGCSEGKPEFGTGNSFKWNIGISGYCTEFTAYGNENSTERKTDFTYSILAKYHDIYNCTDEGETNDPGYHRAVGIDKCGKLGTKQSFGQYKSLFINVKNVFSEADDQDIGKPLATALNAIVDSDNIQELYLISHDGKNRLYFRRKLVETNGDVAQYKIQMLRLRGFDAGQAHSFSSISQGSYDGQIDTWACDTSMGFGPSHPDPSNSVGGAYSDYYLPQDVDDCWVDLTYGNTSISTWKLSISPQNDSDLYWNDESRQINPYMKILVVNSIYSSIANSGSSISHFNIPIETTINMKDFYRE